MSISNHSPSPRRPWLLPLVGALMLAAPLPSWSQAAAREPAKEAMPKVKPLVGKEPAFCETCGVVIAINRVPSDELATQPTGERIKGPDRYEVVVRLDAGTQQVVKLDLAPQLKVGQKVRIVDGVVLPELA